MNGRNNTKSSSYSPPISMELTLHGQRFNVASAGPNNLILRNARPLSAGTGVLRLTIDQRLTVYHVQLTQGIDPHRDEQPIQIVGVDAEVAA